MHKTAIEKVTSVPTPSVDFIDIDPPNSSDNYLLANSPNPIPDVVSTPFLASESKFPKTLPTLSSLA